VIDLRQGDCLELMRDIPDRSVDAIICDVPYGITSCAWDSVIPFAPMWEHLKRIIKPRGAIVLFGSQPFTSALVMSNPKWFRYELVWDKVNMYTGTLNANNRPLKRHENILLFSDGQVTYNKQFRLGPKYARQRAISKSIGEHINPMGKYNRVPTVNNGQHNPCSVVEIEGHCGEKGLHPTQKPVALMAYLVKTYTNEGDTVLDFCAGSFTTGVACIETGRNFIGIEKEAEYVAVAQQRLADAAAKLQQLELVV